MSSSRFSPTISRDCGYIMRGLSIIAIALHNFCHIAPHVVRENESEFIAENAVGIVNSDLFSSPQGIFDILSYFGWYGVPVFIFLTGFGLVAKYESPDADPFLPRPFLRANWLKLIRLMVPGILLLIITAWARALYFGHFAVFTSLDYLFQFTMLPDLVYPWSPPNPGVCWYFGMTMQLYLLYALIVHRRRPLLLGALIVLSLALQFSFHPASDYITWIRVNALGWLTVFALGIIWARTSPAIPRPLAIIIALAALVAFIPTTLNPIAWQLSILLVVIIIYALARLSLKIPLWRDAWIFIGRLSPYIFASHPLLRQWLTSSTPPNPTTLLLYAALLLPLALLYRRLTPGTHPTTNPQKP